VRSFRNVAFTVALPLSFLCAGRAEAIRTITQTVSNQTPNAFNNLTFARAIPGSGGVATRTTTSSFLQNFDKFDTSQGTLVNVRFVGNGDLLGSFRGAKSSDNTPAAGLTGGTAALSLTFTEGVTSWNTSNTGGPVSFIRASALATTTAAAIGTAGTVLTSTDPTLNLSGSDTGTYFSLFEGFPGDIIAGTFTWGLQLTSNNLSISGACGTTVNCTGFNFNPTLGAGQTRLGGDINDFKLFYDYEPFPTPAPLPILGSGVAFAYTRRLRRRIQKARFSL